MKKTHRREWAEILITTGTLSHPTSPHATVNHTSTAHPPPCLSASRGGPSGATAPSSPAPAPAAVEGAPRPRPRPRPPRPIPLPSPAPLPRPAWVPVPVGVASLGASGPPYDHRVLSFKYDTQWRGGPLGWPSPSTRSSPPSPSPSTTSKPTGRSAPSADRGSTPVAPRVNDHGSCSE